MQSKINFGTDGIRGKADQYPFLDKTLNYFGTAIAKWSILKYQKQTPRLLIGYDTRFSCTRIQEALCLGLRQYPLDIKTAGIVPTPAICNLIQSNRSTFDFGIVISASHNPYFDNGIKIFDKTDTKLTKNDEETIINLFTKLEQEQSEIKMHPLSKVEIWKDAKKEYIKNILSFFEPNFLQKLKIVIDCANGSTYEVAPEIFKELGAQVIPIFVNPDGKNINENCGALHPQNLQRAVLENNANIGFAFDGDGDRLIAVSRYGQIQDGDSILAILLNHPLFKDTKQIVGTIMTNHGLEIYLEKNGKKLLRTPVGDKYIAAKLSAENLLIGGENSGHIIMKDYMNSGDGIFNALRVIQTILLTNNWEFETFPKTPQVLTNINVQNKKDLSTQPFCNIIKNYEKLLNNGRIIVRYSGTENLLRVMVEDVQEETAKNIAQNLAHELVINLNK